MRKNTLCVMLGAAFLISLVCMFPADEDKRSPVIPNLPASLTFSATTVPSNGDLNPYGFAFVPRYFRQGGPLKSGDVPVSNFNDINNHQGTAQPSSELRPTATRSCSFRGNKALGSPRLGES